MMPMGDPCPRCGGFPCRCPMWTYPSRTPHRCPVCEGRKTVSPGFYSRRELSQAEGEPEKCRTCYGEGIIWSQ